MPFHLVSLSFAVSCTLLGGSTRSNNNNKEKNNGYGCKNLFHKHLSVCLNNWCKVN